MNTGTLDPKYGVPLRSISGAVPLRLADVDADDWMRIAHAVEVEGGRLLSIWGTDRRPLADNDVVSAAYCATDGLLWIRLKIARGQTYPDLTSVFPSAVRMQRMLFDLLGIAADEADDKRHWINHGRWPKDFFPLRHDAGQNHAFDTPLESYPFVTVEGDGVHEIAVGPIHAGIIEPGHFRFSVVGEKVLRLEERLGYTHKGTDKLFIGRSLIDGAKLAGRISGDSTVAFSLAYCMAAEGVATCNIPRRAEWLRALLLERERVANHLGDLGALGNDAGLGLGLAQFMRLKEDWLRLNHQLFGHRFAMDRIIPGGVTIDLDRHGNDLLMRQCEQIETEVRALREIYEEHAGLQDRFIATGYVVPKLAAELNLCGMTGRASGQAFDARADQPFGPYQQLKVRMATHRNGDVAARVTVRFEEIFESLRLIREMVSQLPAGSTLTIMPANSGGEFGCGWVEGWRGGVYVALETGPQGAILRCHCHDPSWQNWPVLQHAIMGNIVPDFPLINKSFNLSYSGHDR